MRRPRVSRGAVLRLCLALALPGLLAGCTTVHPWDRDLLAEKWMRLNPCPQLRAIDDQDVGGGGCGCN